LAGGTPLARPEGDDDALVPRPATAGGALRLGPGALPRVEAHRDSVVGQVGVLDDLAQPQLEEPSLHDRAARVDQPGERDHPAFLIRARLARELVAPPLQAHAGRDGVRADRPYPAILDDRPEHPVVERDRAVGHARLAAARALLEDPEGLDPAEAAPLLGIPASRVVTIVVERSRWIASSSSSPARLPVPRPVAGGPRRPGRRTGSSPPPASDRNVVDAAAGAGERIEHERADRRVLGPVGAHRDGEGRARDAATRARCPVVRRPACE
jgi:hypothetical protein